MADLDTHFKFSDMKALGEKRRQRKGDDEDKRPQRRPNLMSDAERMLMRRRERIQTIIRQLRARGLNNDVIWDILGMTYDEDVIREAFIGAGHGRSKMKHPISTTAMIEEVMPQEHSYQTTNPISRSYGYMPRPIHAPIPQSEDTISPEQREALYTLMRHNIRTDDVDTAFKQRRKALMKIRRDEDEIKRLVSAFEIVYPEHRGERLLGAGNGSRLRKLKELLRNGEYYELFDYILTWFISKDAPPQPVQAEVMDTWSDNPPEATYALIRYLSGTTSPLRRNTRGVTFEDEE